MILELISVVSLIFSIIALFFNLLEIRLFILFIYVLGISLLFLWDKLRGKWMALLPILLILPFFLEMTWGNSLIILLYSLTLFYYHSKILGRVYLDDLIAQFKIAYIVMFITAFLGLVVTRISAPVIRSLPFMLIYFFTTIMLSSAIRHKAVGIDPRKNRQKLGFYLTLAIIFSLVIGVSQVRAALLKLLSVVAEGLQDVLFFMIYPVIYGISWVFTRVINLISVPLNMEYEEEEVLGQIEEGVTQTAKRVKESPVVEIILIIAVASLVIFLAYRYIKAMAKKKESKLPYVEHRDFIMESARRKKKKLKDKLPSEANGQFRYYYRQYLRKVDQKIPLSKSDTSLSVREKSKSEIKINEEIRELYIKYRYTEKLIDLEIVEKMKNLTQDNK